MTAAIGGLGAPLIRDRLSDLLTGARAVDLAVSYMQVGGWNVLEPLLSRVDPAEVRLVCTDQLGITDPRAVRLALNAGIRVRRYSGRLTYHPKVYLSHTDAEVRFLVGSANLSESALMSSVEVAVRGVDDGALADWFDDLFDNKATEFTEPVLEAMAEALRIRIKGQLKVKKVIDDAADMQDLAEATAIEPLDALLGALPDEIGLLNFDHGGNTVRNLPKAFERLTSGNNWSGKQQGEMRRLGFGEQQHPTDLGVRASRMATSQEVADAWAAWLKHASEDELLAANPRGVLLHVRKVLTQFWELDPEVREFFLNNSTGAKADTRQRRVLQTIELLANVGPVANRMKMADVEILATALENRDSIPASKRALIVDYLENKGTRSWQYDDRRVIPLAFARA